jgi:hypothetical protein
MVVDSVMIDADPEDNGTEPRDEATIKAELGYEQSEPDDNPPPNVAGDIYTAIVEAGLSENVHAAKNVLTHYCKTGYSDEDAAIAWMRLYRGWRDMDDKTTPQEAAEKANAGDVPK